MSARSAALSLALLGAASALLAEPPVVIQPRQDDTVVETRTWNLGGTPKLKVVSDVGRVRITAWDKPQAELSATFKPSSRGDHMRLEAQADGGRLEIRTDSPRRRWFQWGNSASCTLELKVPRECVATVRTDVGRIEVDGVKGPLDVRSDVGAITLRGLEGHDKGITATTDVGKISIELRGVKGALDARTDVGTIRLDVPGMVLHHSSRRHLEGTLNGGNAPIRLQTDVGSIRGE